MSSTQVPKTEPSSFNKQLDFGDYAVVASYFGIVIATGLWSMWKTKNRGTVDGYFLAGRYMYWATVGASVFASNIGSEHFIGLAGSGAASGIGVAAFELNALLILQITGWLFLPVFLSSRVCTLPEFMTKRFGGKRVQTYLALLSLALYIFTKISVNLFSGAIFIQQALGWNIYVSVCLLLGITAISTITGGLAAVMYTDTVQTIVMLVGGLIVLYSSLNEIGGFGNLRSKYFAATPALAAGNSTCAAAKDRSFMILRPLDDPDTPWLGFILGQTWSSMWYWCTDQVIVQRLLASKNLSHAQGGTLFSGFLKMMPLFLIIIPGMVSRILYTEEIACADPMKCYEVCRSYTGCSNIAYPKLVLNLMPSGLRGLMMAGMLAALMSGLSSIFNSCSTMFTIDIWPLVRPKASVKEQMIVGRVFVILMIGVSIAWIAVMQSMQSGELYIYIQAVASILSPPIAVVYLLSVIWPRMNEPGAFWTLIIGLIIGTIRMVLEVVYTAPVCGEADTRPWIMIQYMYFAMVLGAISVVISVVVSLMTEPVEEFRLIRTTYSTRWDEREREDEQKESTAKPATPKAIEMMDWQRASTRSKMSRTGSLRNRKKLSMRKTPAQTKKQKSTMERILSGLNTFWTWFCGVEDTGADAEAAADGKEDEPFDPAYYLDALYQTTFEKVILRLSLLAIVVIAGFIFIYFSLPLHLKQPNE